MNISNWIDGGALALTLGGTCLVSFWMLRLNQWSLMGKMILELSRKSRNQAPKQIALETLKLANAYKNYSPHLEQLIKDCAIPLLKESIEMAREGVLDEASLLQVVQARVNASFLNNMQIANKLRLLSPYPASVGIFGAIVCCYFIVQKLIGQPVETETSRLLSFGVSSLAYGTFFTYLVLFPLSRALKEWAKEQRLNHTLILVGTKLLVQKANPVLVTEELNSYLTEEDRVDWKAVTNSKRSKA
jgi:flagellar motor component MotA